VVNGALRRLWTDTFSVFEQRKIVKANGATGFEVVAALEDLPCKLSFMVVGLGLSPVEQGDMTAELVQTVKLFCDKGLDVPAGSKIVVARGARTFEYGRSGEPAVFSVHQEIELMPWKGWA
jgi:hypothetical protein